MQPNYLRPWIVLSLLIGILAGLARLAEPSVAQTVTPQDALILSGDPKLPKSVYVFAKDETLYGIYYLEGRNWRLITSVPVSAVTVDTVKAKLSPNQQLVAYMVTDGKTGNSAIFVTDLFGINTSLIYASDYSGLAATSFAWHGNDQIAYTLARGPFAGEAGAEGVINLLEQAAKAPYTGEVWISSIDGQEHIQLVDHGAGEVLGSINGTEPLFFTSVNTTTQQLIGLNSIASDGTITPVLQSQIDESGQGTVYLWFNLVQTAPGEIRIAAVATDKVSMAMPENGTRLLTAALDGSDIHEVLRDPLDIGTAAWSPLGDKVAIVRTSTGEALIHDLSQGTHQELPVLVQSELQWNTDGTAIVASLALSSETNPFTKGIAAIGLDGTTVASLETQAVVTTQEYTDYFVPGFNRNEPYVHQSLDTPERFQGKASACGSASVVMALAGLGKLPRYDNKLYNKEKVLGEYVAEFHNGHYYEGKKVYSASFGREPAEEALKAYRIDQSKDDRLKDMNAVIAALKEGHPVIMGTPPGALTSAGHIVLIIGYRARGNSVDFFVHDPWGNKNDGNYGKNRGNGVIYSWQQLTNGKWSWQFKVNSGPVIPKWRGEYFNNLNLSGQPGLVRYDDRIDFNWSNSSPDKTIKNENFSVRWSRTVNFNRSGVYRFSIKSDDGVRISIDGKPFFDHWDRGYINGTATADIYIPAGEHRVVIEYRQYNGPAFITVEWSYLTSDFAWEGSYFNNPNHSGPPVVTRNDEKIDFWWGWGSPHNAINPDHFSVRWKDELYLPAGAWVFNVRADDMAKVYVDGRQVLTYPSSRASVERLSAGKHSLQVDFTEYTQQAYITFSFSPKVLAEFWDNKGNYLWKALDTVDMDWKSGGPHNSRWQDNFQSRFTWPVSLSGGEYRICVQADDGFRFYVDNQLKFERWYYKNETICRVLWIDRGWRTFRIDHFEGIGSAKLRVTWGRADRNVWYGVATPSMSSSVSTKTVGVQSNTVDDVAQYFQLFHDRGTLGPSLEAEPMPIHTVNVPLVVR